MPDTRTLLREAPDQSLAEGVRSMVHECLRLVPADRFVLVADDSTKVIAAEVLRSVRAVGASTEAFLLEARGPRPTLSLPREIAWGLERATASLLMCSPQPGEVGMRVEVVDLAIERKLRHAHAPGLTLRMVREGARATPDDLGRRNRTLIDYLGRAREMHFRSAKGTNLRAVLDPTSPWGNTDGRILPGVFANLPAGQVTHLPRSVDGVFVADGSLSEWFGPRYGTLVDRPVTLHIEGSRVREVTSPDAALAREVRGYLRGDPEGDRIGEIGFGTNPKVPGLIGLSLQDELYPTSHVALGRPHPIAKVSWTARTHLSCVAGTGEILADGKRVLANGRFDPWVDA